MIGLTSSHRRRSYRMPWQATAVADFVLVDMFANYCTGREDVKGAIAITERQLKRIYR